MSTNEQKIAVLTADKNVNLNRITELEQYIINLDNQINSNLSMNLTYEQQKTDSNAQIIELENDNLVIDDMIADYS